VKRDLLVGVAQWLSAPGEPKQNLAVALGMIENAAARGVELLVLPELWSCGYDPETLAEDVRRDAEPRDGGRSTQLADAARRHGLFLAAGSVPELGDDGLVYDTALVFDPRGQLAAWHRKAHLYGPTLEHTVFTPGDRLTTFDDPTLGRVGLVVGFDGDFPEVGRALALRGARLVLAPSAFEVESAPAWDLLQPAVALTNSQWWVQANQAGSHSSSTLLGASRIIAPTGTVVAQASGAVPGRSSPAELLVHRLDLHLAYQREGVAAYLEEERHPDLYAELVDRVPAPH
jgi:predicted amidohydrolase